MSDDLYGYIPESYLCIDCGYNTQPKTPNRVESEQIVAEQKAGGIKNWSLPMTWTEDDEAYFVHDHIWKAAGMKCEWGDGALCIGCLEKRIGRQLKPYDFAEHPFNNPSLPGTRRRLERLTGYETVEGLEDDPEPPPASKLDIALHAAIGSKQWRAAS